MHCFGLWVKAFKVSCAVPDNIDSLFVVDSVEDAIAAKHDEVMLLSDSEGFDLRCRN